MTRLNLLNLEQTSFTNRYLPSGSDVYKRDKILMKNIYTLDKEHRNIPDYIVEAKEHIIDYMKQSEILTDYYNKKVQEWDKTKFR